MKINKALGREMDNFRPLKWKHFEERNSSYYYINLFRIEDVKTVLSDFIPTSF